MKLENLFYERLLWTDETKIELFGHNYRNPVWGKEAYSPKNTVSTVKFGGGSIMVLEWFSSKDVGKISVIDGKMNAQMYKQILQENFMFSVDSLELPSDYIFQQDNDPKHTAKSTKKWLSENNVNVMQWSSRSPNLNPIENLGQFLKIQIWKRAPANINNLKTICQEEWYKILTNYCKKLTENNRKRLVTVEMNKGYSTKYQMKIMRYFLYCTVTIFTRENELKALISVKLIVTQVYIHI